MKEKLKKVWIDFECWWYYPGAPMLLVLAVIVAVSFTVSFIVTKLVG